MRFRLKNRKGGPPSVYDGAYGEAMHPGPAPWEEATGLYVAGGGLAARLTARDGKSATATEGARGARGASRAPGGALTLFDVGLGAGANALAAIDCHTGLHRRSLQRRGLHPAPLHLISFEQDPGALRFALEEASALAYLHGYEDAVEALLSEGRVELPGGVLWELRLGDFARLIQEEPRRAGLIFFDPFSPRSNPDMWSVPVLEALHGCRRPGGETRLVTYSSSFAARAGLLLAGFFVGEGPRVSSRHGTTIASTIYSELEFPLNPGWLARWRRERDPWPPLTPPQARKQLRQALLEHPQWSQLPRKRGRPGGGAKESAPLPGNTGGGRRRTAGKSGPGDLRAQTRKHSRGAKPPAGRKT